MTFIEKMKAIKNDVAAIRESMQVVDPRTQAVDMREAGQRAGRITNAQWQRKVVECAKLIRDVKEGRIDPYFLKEAMTTSDFPNLFGDVLYRQMLGNFVPWPVSYPDYMRSMTVNDFRTLNMYTLDGGQAVLTAVGEKEPYPETSFTEGKKTLSVSKYGRRYGISWEMIINDDLNAFNERPMLMAQAARFSEEYLACKTIFDANGPDATFFSSGNGNIVTSNPALTIAGLQTAFTQLRKLKNSDGIPIVIQAVTLLTGPGLEITAQNILNAIELRMNAEGGGTANTQLITRNWMAGKVKLSINPFIPIVVTNGTRGDTSWALIANPQDVTQRPAFAFGHLRGYENPQLWVKSPNSLRLGGGNAPVEDGSFENDSIDYKLRHVFGAATVEPKMAVASNGTGS